MTARPIVILHAPSPLGLEPPRGADVPGVRNAPTALRALGLHESLNAEYAGAVEPPPYIAMRDARTRVRNAEGIARYSAELAEAVTPLLVPPRFPLVLGGDCSIALGIARALAGTGRRWGMLYIDAHSDCQTPRSSHTGGVAGMPLAMITGNAPSVLEPDFTPRMLLAPGAVVLLGVRDLFDIEESDGLRRVANMGIRARDLEETRRTGAAGTAATALADLAAAGIADIWVHLDVDVLDPRIMPAVDSPDPGGLTVAELVELLGALLGSAAVKGMHVTIYDPERDPGGKAGRTLVRLLSAAFRNNPV